MGQKMFLDINDRWISRQLLLEGIREKGAAMAKMRENGTY
jgi:hypothetical protein